METIKVYRYENQWGEGPYMIESSVYDILADSHNNKFYPSWEEDFEEQFKIDYVSGFDSIGSLNKWFDGLQRLLDKAGFEVKTYLIPKENVEYGKSNKQLRFKKL